MSDQHYIERYWRDATPADAIREPPMMARFRDEHYKEWVIDKLIYWDRSETPWNRDDDYCYECCQVYDAPDPGEGWRLIDPDKDKPQYGDQYYFPGSKMWLVRDHEMAFSTKQCYRRRIEQPKPKYEPFRWEDREQLRGRWITWKHEDGTPIETPVTYLVKKESGELLINSRNSKWFLQNATFLDTSEPVGRKVE